MIADARPELEDVDVSREERARAAIDAEVLEHLARGDSAAAATLALKAYGVRILGFLWLILRDDDAAEEAYAQFTEDLWKGIAGFRGECVFRTWAYQIAHNAARRYAKDPFRRRGRRLATSEVDRIPAASTRAPTQDYRRTTLKEGVARLRERLDPDEQALLALRVDQRMSWREVAQVMSEPGGPALEEAALRKRFERLKQRLRDLAREEGLLGGGEP